MIFNLLCNSRLGRIIMAESLRERKRKKTRLALIKAAYKLFSKHGYDEVTVDEVSESAEISRSTFFRYFPTKDAVVFPYQAERIEKLRSLIMQYEADYSPFDAVYYGLLDMAAYFKQIRRELLQQRKIIHSSPTLQARQIEFDYEWEAVIAERMMIAGQENPLSQKEARLFAGAIFGVVEVVLREWFAGNCKEDPIQLGHEGLSLLKPSIERFYQS